MQAYHTTTSKSDNLRKYKANAECYRNLSLSICSVLNDVGVCVIDDYIPDINMAENILHEVKELYATPHLFHKADEYSTEDDCEPYRSDYIHWLNGNEASSTDCIEKLEKSFEVLMASCVKLKHIPKLTHKSRFQVSCFPQGSFGYKQHTDNGSDNGRLLTIVYYCVGRGSSGGIHRFHVAGNNRYESFDIEPKFNRAVIYWSDKRVFHETLECNNDLFSLSSWYFHSLTPSSFSR